MDRTIIVVLTIVLSVAPVAAGNSSGIPYFQSPSGVEVVQLIKKSERKRAKQSCPKANRREYCCKSVRKWNENKEREERVCIKRCTRCIFW